MSFQYDVAEMALAGGGCPDGFRRHPDPFQPRSVDLWAGAQIAALVAEAREVNDGLRACSFLNMADAQGRDNEEALEALKTMEGIEALSLVGEALGKSVRQPFVPFAGLTRELKGNRNALKHGASSAETLALKTEVQALARMARETMAAIE